MSSEWTPDLKINHELLDTQHADLFRSFAHLADCLPGAADGIEKALSELSDLLVTHFATEEQIMGEVLYPERARHKSAHELFMADFLQLRELLRDEGVTAGVDDWVRRRLPEWLRFHISVNDFPLGVYLARRRAQPGGGARPVQAGSNRPS
jgi:hemerythrin-like metal-binding protein